jgi:hypothetical protein
MKTIKQIADEIGVSKQSIQKRISREPLYTNIQPYISTKQRTKYIEDIGENIIKSAFNKIEPITMYIDDADNHKPNLDIGVHSEIIGLLQENITLLQKQLEAKDKQIDELAFTVRIQAESINADRKNELAGTIIDSQKVLAKDIIQKKRKWQFWKKSD